MLLLILDSIGSTELLFILVMALVFFGPRKLPQLSRTLGKNIADFRRASEDFKRTWEREVALEERSDTINNFETHDINKSIMKAGDEKEELLDGTSANPQAEQTIARHSNPGSVEAFASDGNEATNETPQPESLRKQNWL